MALFPGLLPHISSYGWTDVFFSFFQCSQKATCLIQTEIIYSVKTKKTLRCAQGQGNPGMNWTIMVITVNAIKGISKLHWNLSYRVPQTQTPLTCPCVRLLALLFMVGRKHLNLLFPFMLLTWHLDAAGRCMQCLILVIGRPKGWDRKRSVDYKKGLSAKFIA